MYECMNVRKETSQANIKNIHIFILYIYKTNKNEIQIKNNVCMSSRINKR